MISSNRRWFGGFILGAALLPSAAGAQTGSSTQVPGTGTPATSLAELASLVTPGTTVAVTDRAGGTLTGRLASIGGGSLALTVDGRDRTFVEGDLKEVRARVKDSVWDGGAIGFAIGFAAPFLVCTSGSDSSETVSCAAGSLILGGLPGLAIGIVTDVLRARHVSVFRAPSNAATAAVRVAPVIVRRGIELRTTVRF